MALSTTITTLADMMDHCRVRLDDAADPDFIDRGLSHDDQYLLWSNAELVLFANAAIYEVALRSRCLKDRSDTADLTAFAIATTDSGWITVPDQWLAFHRMEWTNDTSGDKARLDRHMQRRLDREYNDWQTVDGDPAYFIMSESARGDIRVFPLPDVDGTLRIEGARLPIDSELMAANDDEPAIPAHYLFEALNWMCHLAYQKNDADTKDPQQEARYEKVFTERFGPRPSALQIECRIQQAQSHRPRAIYR